MAEEYETLYMAYNRLRNLVAAGRSPQKAAEQAAREWAMGDEGVYLILSEELTKVALAIEVEEFEAKVWDAVVETHD